jgi:hypothetical protein
LIGTTGQDACQFREPDSVEWLTHHQKLSEAVQGAGQSPL